MGVPKFFRYISERYPCLSELARDQNIPEFDNLYLDMNGIIHNCSHPDDGNVHFHITEEDMFKDIFNYIDKLFFLINPQKLFFMAVDGVAPRAKMNQQRSRRFRSAKEGELLRQKAISRGEALENEPFDSNCITPGTEFMVRLHEALQYFIKSKITSNPLWQKCRIILSGQNTPGEGEHKIMDYIRYLKSQEDYDENTRHCLYGLDADLIILGLCTHELHFVVLREEVKFGRKAKKAAVEETRFFLLHLGLFREYLEMEFDELFKQKPDFDTAMLIDDWILMGFLVGNDFIPHLPYLHINTNALPLLYKTYIKVFPTLGGNINENGKLNLERLEKYFEALSEVEMEMFRESYADLKYFEDKQSKNGIDEAFDFDVNDIKAGDAESDLAVFIESSKQFFEDDNGSFDEQEQILQEFETYKRNYYMKKLNQTDMSSELKREQAIGYVTALQWILDYYYRGVQSWNWYYPHHYAPFISDLKDFKHHHIQFNMGKPFLPFEQLLAVLPAASRQLLPAAYRELMTSDSSELLHFYPNDFETDLNGKKQEWEAVVLIPFINENILLKAMKPFQHKLTANERERNTHGPMLQYDYNPVSQGSVKGIYSFSTIKQVLCTEKKIWSDEIKTSYKTVCVEVESATPRVLLMGFPTMKHLKYDFQIKMSRIKVFDHASRNESLILMPQDRPEYNDVFIVAEKFLNKVVYIGWPYLIKAIVIAVSSKDKNITSDGVEYMEPKVFQLQSKSLQEHFITRMGIEFSNFSVLVHVKTHIGTTYACGSHGLITTKDSWSSTVTAYPAQGLVSDTSVYSNVPCGNNDIESIFPVDSQIFFVGNPYFGAEGKVVNPLMIYECGRLKINITVLPEPDLSAANFVQKQLQSDYINSFEASVLTGIPVKCLGRLTGTILVVTGPKRSNVSESTPKTNIGLQLKFPKQQEERAGYARRVGIQWYYSSKAVGIVKLYCSKYPAVVEYLAKSSSRAEFIFESDLFPNNVGEGLIEKISSWLKDQHHMNAERITCGTQTAEKESVQVVLNSVEKLKDLPLKTVRLQVKPHLLLKPDVSLPEVYKSMRAVSLFDRVVVVKSTYMVPVGARGTVVGIQPVADPNPVRLECLKKIENFLDILFDKHLPNTNSIHGIAYERVYKVPESSVLLTHNQDTKQNERLHNNIPASADVKGKVSLAPFNPTNNFQANICDVLPPTNINQLYPPSQPCLRTPRNYTAEDFWMPSANAKVQHFTQIAPEVKPSFIYNPTPISTNSSLQIMPEFTPILASHPTINPQQQSSNYSMYNDCKAGTQVLKNLLGITGNSTDSSRITNKPANYMDLPAPPLNWRLSSVDSNVKHRSDNLAPLTTQAPKKVPDIEENCIRSIATYNANAMSPAIADKGQTVENILTLPPERLFNSGSLSQKGAFIPIQGNLSTSTRHNLNDFIAVNSIANQECSPSDAATITTPTRENNVDTSMRNELSTEQLQRRIKPPRTPKIAAKFDNAPE